MVGLKSMVNVQLTKGGTMKSVEQYVYSFGVLELRRVPVSAWTVSMTLFIKADRTSMDIVDEYRVRGLKVMGEELHAKWGYYSEEVEATRHIREEFEGITLEHAFESAREKGLEEAKALDQAIYKKGGNFDLATTSDALKVLTGRMVARWSDHCKYDPASVAQCFHGIQKNLDQAIDAGDFEYFTQCLVDVCNYALLAYMAQSKVLESVKKA